jgi:hypothetical protein
MVLKVKNENQNNNKKPQTTQKITILLSIPLIQDPSGKKSLPCCGVNLPFGPAAQPL